MHIILKSISTDHVTIDRHMEFMNILEFTLIIDVFSRKLQRNALKSVLQSRERVWVGQNKSVSQCVWIVLWIRGTLSHGRTYEGCSVRAAAEALFN